MPHPFRLSLAGLLVLTAGLLAADPVVKLPATVRAKPGRLLTIKADSDGKLVRWVLASDEADLVPFPDGKTAIFSSPKPGTFLVLAWTAAGDVPSEAARCVITVGDPQPEPIPVPPTPVPPADPLAAKLQAAYAADASATKAAALADLVELYTQAVAFAGSADVTSAADLNARLKAAAATLVPSGVLVAVRTAIAAELAAGFPDPAAALTPDARKSAAALFGRIASALKQVK